MFTHLTHAGDRDDDAWKSDLFSIGMDSNGITDLSSSNGPTNFLPAASDSTAVPAPGTTESPKAAQGVVMADVPGVPELEGTKGVEHMQERSFVEGGMDREGMSFFGV